MRKKILIICLIIILLMIGFFIYQWWQTKEQLKKPIKQKQAEELKDVEKEVIDEIADWKVYRNINQGFEIKYPPVGEWDYDIRIDEIGGRTDLAFFDGFFTIREEKSHLSFVMRINLFSEVTPPFIPQGPFCNKTQEIQIWNNKISQTIYSTYNPQIETEKEECDPSLDKFLLDEHTIESRICPSKNLKAYDAELGRNGEYFFYCRGEDPLYYFSLNCKGEIWAGKEGRDECNKLFNQILSTFKFIK